jgi:ribosome-associated protein
MPAPLYHLPETAIEERFLAATGPGGQNVNKVATAVQAKLDVFALGLVPDVFRRLKILAGQRWTLDGCIVVVARSHRTREANRDDARARLAALVEKAHVRPVRRVKTKPSAAAKAKRVTGKVQRGAVKKMRGKAGIDV